MRPNEELLKRMPLTIIAQSCIVHAHTNSLCGGLADTITLKEYGDNQYLVISGDCYCSAIFNIFVGRFYADNLYGIISQERADEIVRG
jgi:hypothetical protein